MSRFLKEYRLFIISSGHDKGIIGILKNNNILNLFQKSLFLEDHKLKGSKFKMLENDFGISTEDTVFVTDSTGDIFEAREVGYKSIGITTGVHTREELEKLNPLTVVDNFKELYLYMNSDKKYF